MGKLLVNARQKKFFIRDIHSNLKFTSFEVFIWFPISYLHSKVEAVFLPKVLLFSEKVNVYLKKVTLLRFLHLSTFCDSLYIKRYCTSSMHWLVFLFYQIPRKFFFTYLWKFRIFRQKKKLLERVTETYKEHNFSEFKYFIACLNA